MLQYFHKILKFIVICTCVLLLIRSFIIEPGKVNGQSMEPTFYDNNLFFVNKFILLCKEPKRGNIVQFYSPNSDKLIVKRVIGLPGERIYIKQNSVFIINSNNEEVKLDEPYLQQDEITRSIDGKATLYEVIPDNSYFVLGDNRQYSNDSRNFGPVHRSYINGRLFSFSF